MSEIFQLFFHYVNALWKRRWLVLIGAWAVAIPGWLAVASMPSVYQSSSRIYVDTTNVLQPLLRGIAIQTNLDAQVQLMQQTLLSRPNLMEVARKTDYDLNARGPAQMESLLNSIQRRTTVASNREDIFLISFEDPNPQRARDVVQALLTIFVESNLGQSRQDLDTAEEFIDRQISDYEARLEAAEDRLAKFKQEHIDVVLGEGSYLSRATSATQVKEQLEEDLSVAIAQRDLLRKELTGIPETLPTAGTNGPPDDTHYRIVELEAQLRQLLSQYTEKHPDVVTLRRQLDALLAKQEAAQRATPAEGTGPGPTNASADANAFGSPNPVYGQVKLQLIQIETQIENLQRRAATARAEADALAAKAEEVPRVEAEYQRLNRDYDIIKSRHDELLARRESARMSRNRDAVGQEVQYRLIEPPIVPSKPVGPNRPLFLFAVLVLSVGAGVGLALLLVILDTSFSTIVELRNFAGIPVLGAVTDTRRRTTSRLVDTVTLGAATVSLVLVFALLLVVERQYGLDTVVKADLGGNIFSQGSDLVVQKASEVLNWMRSIVEG